MDRRSFIRQGCAACLGATALSAILASCKTVRYATGTLQQDGLELPLDEFRQQNGAYRPYVIVRHPALLFPVCVYRFGERDYAALWMQCAHQGAELQAAGDRLICPAHGSEFDSRGQVRQGPAGSDLRTFPVTVSDNHLFIDLRKQS